MGGLGNRMFQFTYIYSQYQKGLVPDVYIQDYEYCKEVKEDIHKR